MKKITVEEFNILTPEQQNLLTVLGIKPVESTPGKTVKSQLEEYVCVVETYCKLCGTIETKVFLMEGVGNVLLSKPAELSEVEGMTIKTREESTLTCPSCHDNLKLMEQEDLISLTIKVAKGQHRYNTRTKEN